jgi:hypothetical protein
MLNFVRETVEILLEDFRIAANNMLRRGQHKHPSFLGDSRFDWL